MPPTATAGAVNTADYEQYGYDLASNRTSLRKRDARSIGYTYDALNRMTVKDIPGSTTLDVYYGYDLRGLETYARFASTAGQGVTQAWDGFGRLSSSATNQGGTTRTMTVFTTFHAVYRLPHWERAPIRGDRYSALYRQASTVATMSEWRLAKPRYLHRCSQVREIQKML